MGKMKTNKLMVLSLVAHAFNENGISWAVGASALLYFKGLVTDFHDIDISVSVEDADKAKDLLLKMGRLEPYSSDEKYKTRRFMEFTVDDVEIDVMAGFVILKDGIEYDCSFNAEQIAEYIKLNGENIPLHSVSDWRRYYELMGRTEKVKIIDGLK